MRIMLHNPRNVCGDGICNDRMSSQVVQAFSCPDRAYTSGGLMYLRF